MKAVLVCYEQVFGGELLRDSYVRYIDNDDEKIEIMQALYDDPHVTRVWFEEVKENGISEECPLKEMPKGHGRLIDAERLKEVFRRNTGYDYHDLIDIAPSIDSVIRASWLDNHNGTITCSHCKTWFYKDDRYSYMRYCPYCNVKMAESEE